jgi:hypothetical protein
VAVLGGCVTLPGHVSEPPFVPRVVDREYGVVWQTLQAALRNEGAPAVTANRDRGVIETAYRLRPGTKVLAHGLLGAVETQNAQMVQVRYSVRALPLGPETTEVRVRTEIQYLDRAVGGWVRAADDGSLMESFWRRFQQDLVYYGARPETWRPDTPGEATSPAAAGPPPGPTGEDAPKAEPR